MTAEEGITVAFIQTSSGSMTGAPKMIARLLDGLGDGFDPVLIVQRESQLTEYARESGVQVEVVAYPGILDSYGGSLLSKSPLSLARTVARIGQYNVRARRVLSDVDVIWTDSIRTLLTVAPIAAVHEPVIWNVGLGKKSEGAFRWLHELGFRLADYVFIESETQARRVFGEQYERYQNQFEIFHKGVDTDVYAPRRQVAVSDGGRDDESITIGTAGTLTERKGHHLALDAIAAVVESNPGREITYRIAGGASTPDQEAYREALKQQVRDQGLEDVVEFVGWVDSEDMPTFYNSLDIFVLASINEGIPGVVREAMSCGLPVVATDVGGTCDVVRDRETGVLVDPEDVPALADGLCWVVDHPDERERLGAAARREIKAEFSIESYVREYQEFLKRIA